MPYKDPAKRRECGRNHYVRNKDAVLARQQAYKDATRAPGGPEVAADLRAFRAELKTLSPKERRKAIEARFHYLKPEKRAAYKVKHLYGLSEADHRALFDAQAGACAICKKPGTLYNAPGTTKGAHERLNVDHCHASGKVRGLLCGHCNNGIGRFLDSPELLRRAAEYLERP